jgi:PQQ-like domain
MHFSTKDQRGLRFSARVLLALIIIALLLPLMNGCSTASGAAGSSKQATRSSKDPSEKKPTPTPSFIPAPDNTAMLTYKNNNLRTGQDANETLLNTTNVNASTFGKRVSYPVDGAIYTQPLFVPDLTINGQKHNTVFVATENDSVYAFDADKQTSNTPLWHVNFTNPAQGITTLSPSDVSNCGDIGAEIGITGTPVIDSTKQTLYVVVDTKENGQYVQRLHALDITTGNERSGSPVAIQANVQGTGDGSQDGTIDFDAQTQNQRPALLLVNGTVYISWSSFCDDGFYHGWILGYDENSLQQTAVYNDSPDGYQGGIWQGGEGLAADNTNNIFVSTSNGTFNLDSGGNDASNTVLKLTTQLQVEDYFTPFDQSCLEAKDTDFGSGGVVLFPSSNKLVTVGKEGRVYLLDRDNLGKYNTIDDPCDNLGRTDVDTTLQELPPTTIAGGLYISPTYWNGANGDYIFMGGGYDYTKAYSVSSGTLNLSSQTAQRFVFPGSGTAVSCNGTVAGSAILWVVESSGALHAYDASNLTHELYNTNQHAQHDSLGSYVKFSIPTIANGKVFVGTQKSLVIYGLL